MPTKRPRHVITETPEVAAALDAAAERWPHERASRAKLLLHLVEEGHHAVSEANGQRLTKRREAVSRTAGTLSGVYGPHYLEHLREDWPE